jgi:hypothetical protein
VPEPQPDEVFRHLPLAKHCRTGGFLLTALSNPRRSALLT